jgi:hypothetical protein
MHPLRLDETLQVPTFRQKWAALPPEDRTLIRLAFADLQRSPLLAEHCSWLLGLRRWLVEIHTVLVGFVVFTFCEVLATGAVILIDALVLPAIDGRG